MYFVSKFIRLVTDTPFSLMLNVSDIIPRDSKFGGE